MVNKPGLGVKCRHTPTSRSGDGLLIVAINKITTGEHTINTSVRRATLNLHIAFCIHRDLVAHKLGLWLVPNSHKKTINRKIAELTSCLLYTSPSPRD